VDLLVHSVSDLTALSQKPYVSRRKLTSISFYPKSFPQIDLREILDLLHRFPAAESLSFERQQISQAVSTALAAWIERQEDKSRCG